VLSMFWKPFTTRGAQASILFGTVATLLLIIYISPTIQMDLVGHKTTYFPYRNPGLFTIPLSFAVGIVVSWLTPEPSATEQFAKLEQQIHFGELN
jgi:cation/acetate symporter